MEGGQRYHDFNRAGIIVTFEAEKISHIDIFFLTFH